MTIEICQNADLVVCHKSKYFFQKEMESDSAASSAEGQGIYECTKCQKKFRQPEVLQLHTLLHESSEVAEEAGALDNAEPPKGTENDKCFNFGDSESGSKTVKTEFLQSSSKRSVGLTKVKLEDCLRCDECSCIYIHENDYKKHMKNFHKGDTSRKSKQRKGCRSCCKQCNCRQSYKTIQKERGNNNLFHYNIKDRWSKMVSRRLKLEPANDSVNNYEAVKMEPDVNHDYSELLSRVEVSIKTEPPEELPPVSVQMEQSCPQIGCGPRGA
ncbi:uncharacterized protein [Hetaerina americana]|uniref:uncharacterized protein n=1 Tax=Hetaerina americana TaxID=62018 RepID=UPI003A7F4A49